MLTKLTAGFAGKLAQFRRSTSGNIAVIFAIVLVPILGFIGAAVDYSRVAKDRSAMQAALDSAALMVSKDVAAASPAMTAAQITAKAQAYFNALYNRPEVSNVTVTASYSSSGGTTITMTGQGSMQTQFLNVIGFPTLTFGSTSKTTWGTQALRVAMVLDNTGSMADNGKMPAMKAAAKQLITTLSGLAKNPGDVYISLVPFAKDVNVGATNFAASWIDWTDWNAANTTTTTSQGACIQYFLFFCIQYATNTVTTTAAHTTWTGCITDRTQDYDTKNTTPTSAAATQFPAEDYYENGIYYCNVANVAAGKGYLQPVIPLTYVWTLLNTSIDAMTPTGSTNQPIGLAWGWQTLTQGLPMNAPAEAANTTYTKAIVLLSDGLNTADRWPANGNGQTQYNGAIDARQKILCDNIKAAGITIYSMQVNTSGDPTSTVLQYCASGTSNFYLVTSASQIMTAFNSIGTSLTKLRIAQ